jgi:colanic acid/amylovoran biosynthesis glycosyltransferase
MTCDILSIVNALGHRSETWLYNQIAGLQRYRVHVLAYRYLHEDEYPYSPVTVLPATWAVTRKMLKLPLFILERKRPPLDIRERIILTRILRRQEIKIVQAHFGTVGYSYFEIVSRFSLPFIVWLYGSDVFRNSGQRIDKLKVLLDTNSIFCCISHALRREVEAMGCAPDRVHVFHPGMDIPPEPPEITLSRNRGIRIISVGRLIDFKDPCGMVNVARILRDRGVQYTWEHLGDGELRPEVENEINRHDLSGHFHLLGEVSNAEVLEKFRSADLMIHNAVVAPDGGRESFGVVLVEAEVAGVPIVSARVGGIPEIVQDQQTGFLVEEGDIEGMADKAALLADDPEMRIRLGKAGHRFALEHFESRKQIEKLEDFYSNLLENVSQGTERGTGDGRGVL